MSVLRESHIIGQHAHLTSALRNAGTGLAAIHHTVQDTRPGAWRIPGAVVATITVTATPDATDADAYRQHVTLGKALAAGLLDAALGQSAPPSSDD